MAIGDTRQPKKAGLKEILVKIDNITDQKLKRMNLVANVHRKNLNDTEKARGIVSVYAGIINPDIQKG